LNLENVDQYIKLIVEVSEYKSSNIDSTNLIDHRTISFT